MKKKSYKLFIFTTLFCLIGMLFANKIPLRFNPSEKENIVSITFNWENKSSSIIENEATSIFEARLNNLKSIKDIISISSNGFGQIQLTIDNNDDIDDVRLQISTVINNTFKDMPIGLSYPIIKNIEKDNIDEGFLSCTISTPKNRKEFKNIIDNIIKPTFNDINGIDKLEFKGLNSLYTIINIDKNRAEKLKITNELISKKIEDYFEHIFIGNIEYSTHNRKLEILSKSVVDNWHIPIKKVNGKIIYLDEIATISEKNRSNSATYKLNGKDVIILNFFAKKETNILNLLSKINSKINKLNARDDIQILNINNESKYLKIKIDNVLLNFLLSLLIFIFLILLIYRSFKYVVIILLSLIINIMLSFILIFLFSIEINTFSLTGFVIAIGIILTNFLLAIENYREGFNEKILTVIYSSNLITLIILKLLSKLRNDLFSEDLANSIIIFLVLSLVITSFLIRPLLQFFRIPVKNKLENKKLNSIKHIYLEILETISKYKLVSFFFLVYVFGLPFFMLPEKVNDSDSTYANWYNESLGSDKFINKIKPVLSRYTGGALKLFIENTYNSSRPNEYKINEKPKLTIKASMNPNTSIDQKSETIIQIEDFLNQFAEVEYFITEIKNDKDVLIEVSFTDNALSTNFPSLLKEKIISIAIDLSGIKWDITGFGVGFNNKGRSREPENFRMIASGYNFEKLNYWIDELEKKMMSHPKSKKLVRETDILLPINDYFIYESSVDKLNLSVLNTDVSSLYNQIKFNSNDNTADLYISYNNELMPIVFNNSDSKNKDLWKINNLVFRTDRINFKIDSLLNFKKKLNLENILRENQEYKINLSYQYYGNLDNVTDFLDEKLDSINNSIPIGFKIIEQKELYELEKNNNENLFLLILILSIVAIYFICSILFQSYYQPFIILITILVNFIGVFLSYYLFDISYNNGTILSFFLLTAISSYYSSLIVNRFNDIENNENILSSHQIYILVLEQKTSIIFVMIAISITSFIPYLINNNDAFWHSLSVGIISGLFFSWVSIFFYIPIFLLSNKINRN